jgi:hypothetical protein
MTKKQLKLKIKTELKSLAQKIREQKNKRTSVPNGYVSGLDYNRNSYRHKHIAYCLMFNNTPYHMIECPREDNKPSKYSLESYEKEWEGLIDEETIYPSS